MAINANTVTNPTILHPLFYPVGMLVKGKFGGRQHNTTDNKHGMYIFRTWHTRTIICKYYYPYFPGTDRQTAMNTYMAEAVSNWQGFSETEKNFYRFLKYPKRMSGYNRYLRNYLLSMVKYVV